MEIIWESEDGYVAGSRPQTFNITADYFEDYMDVDDIIDELVELLIKLKVN